MQWGGGCPPTQWGPLFSAAFQSAAPALGDGVYGACGTSGPWQGFPAAAQSPAGASNGWAGASNGWAARGGQGARVTPSQAPGGVSNSWAAGGSGQGAHAALSQSPGAVSSDTYTEGVSNSWLGGGGGHGRAAASQSAGSDSNGWGSRSWRGGASQSSGWGKSKWSSGGNDSSQSGGSSWKDNGGSGGGTGAASEKWTTKGACFTCGSTDHQQDECPKRKAFFNKVKKWHTPGYDNEPDIDVEARPHAQPFLAAAQFQTPQEHAEVMAYREGVQISVKGESPALALKPISKFSELDGILPPYVTEALAKINIQTPMPVQQQTLPYLLQGFDLIGIAKTGSGKTMAFILPAIAHLEREAAMQEGEASPTALVLAPVRELAVQIAEEANKILWYSKSQRHPKGQGCVALYGGGVGIRFQQIDELKKGWCQLIAGTPGRVVDLAISGELKLERVVYFVLDEADRMLDSGFEEQMDAIAQSIRSDRQTAFFSATWPVPVRKLAKRMCAAPPIRVNVGQAEEQETGESGPAARNDIVQEIVVYDGDWQVVEKQKLARLNSHVRQLLANPEFKVLVFVNTKQLTWELAEKLQEEGFQADFMYGGRSQDARHEVVRKFKEGESKLLVTTDVMARGLDIPNISHVVVHDCFGGIDEYVHRIGRTARGPYGKGHALTFFEYDPKYSEMAGELIKVLEESNQAVPPELQKIANEVRDGLRAVKYQKTKGW